MLLLKKASMLKKFMTCSLKLAGNYTQMNKQMNDSGGFPVSLFRYAKNLFSTFSIHSPLKFIGTAEKQAKNISHHLPYKYPNCVFFFSLLFSMRIIFKISSFALLFEIIVELCK